MTHPGLRAERSPDGFRRLLLAAPQRHNPITPGLAGALRDAFAADPAEPVVLGSTDPAVFCAGADMTIGEAERAQVSACASPVPRRGSAGSARRTGISQWVPGYCPTW